VLSEEAEKYQVCFLWFDPPGLENTTNSTQGRHANRYTTDAIINITTS
jgi:hypothetical protein